MCIISSVKPYQRKSRDFLFHIVIFKKNISFESKFRENEDTSPKIILKEKNLNGMRGISEKRFLFTDICLFNNFVRNPTPNDSVWITNKSIMK